MGEMALEGFVTSGLGKGAVFMSIDYYKKNVREKLGFDPYPGTLNLRIDKGAAGLLKKLIPIRIGGFKKNSQSFGGADCYKIKINSINGSIIVPDLAENEESIIEIIAQVNLKSELKIKDGDKVKVIVQQ